MKRLLALLLFPMLALGQATTGYHRVAQVIARAPLNSVTAQVVPYATVVLTNTATGVAAAVYSDPLLSVGIPNSTLTADGSGNYNYYFNLGVCVTETISSPNMGIIAIPNICSNGGGGGGSGTVTSVSCGNLNPLFNCSVTSPTTTPAISYALQTASNFTFYGNFSGGTAAPFFWNLAAGSNVSLTPSLGNTLTISATGGGGGTSQKWPILSWTGLQTANSQVFASVMIAPAAGTIPSGCTGSASDTFPTTYTGGAVTYPVATGTPVFAVWDLNTTTNVCNITVSPSGHAGVPSGPGGSISIGDQIVVVGPSTIDASYQNFDITLAVTVAGGGGGGSGTVTQVNTGQGLNGGPITATGTIACDTATTSQIGCVEPDGTIITVASGAITVAKGSSSAFGVLECGSGTTCSGGVITATGSGIPYPSGTGIPAVVSGSSWAASPYNASNTIPANFISLLNQSTTGNAATATALAGSPSQCSVGDSPTGIATNGNAVGCAPLGGSPVWSSLLNPTGNLALTMAANTTILTYGATTGSSDLFKLTDQPSNTGTGILFHLTTASGSSELPWQADANGVGWQIGTNGALIAVGGSTHGITIPAGTAVSGASAKVVISSDATNGYLEANENNTGASRVCTAANGICGGGGNYVNLGSVISASGCTITSGECTMGTAAANVTFSSLPSGYNRLVIVSAAAGTNNSSDTFILQFNADTGSHYWSNVYCGQAPVGTSNLGGADGYVMWNVNGSGGHQSTFTIEIPDYGITTVDGKSWQVNGQSWGAGTGGTAGTCGAGGWWNDGVSSSYPAITSVKIFTSSGSNLAAGSTFTVYGTN